MRACHLLPGSRRPTDPEGNRAGSNLVSRAKLDGPSISIDGLLLFCIWLCRKFRKSLNRDLKFQRRSNMKLDDVLHGSIWNRLPFAYFLFYGGKKHSAGRSAGKSSFGIYENAARSPGKRNLKVISSSDGVAFHLGWMV